MRTLTYKQHVVTALADLADRWGSSPTTSYIHMEDYNHVDFVLHESSSTANGRVVRVKTATSSTGAGIANAAFSYRDNTASDTFGALSTAGASAGLTLAASTAARLLVIGIDAADLPDGSPFVAINVTDSTAATNTVGGVIAVLSEPRFAGASMRTALS